MSGPSSFLLVLVPPDPNRPRPHELEIHGFIGTTPDPFPLIDRALDALNCRRVAGRALACGSNWDLP